jgi:hypothetical protein
MANTSPIFTGTPRISWGSTDGDGGSAGPLKTADTNMDGTGTSLTVFTAGSSGSYLKKLRARGAGSCTATVLRVFINNGSTNATVANNILIDEMSMPTISSSAVQALPSFELALEFAIPNGYKVQVKLGTTVSAGYFVSVIGGDY